MASASDASKYEEILIESNDQSKSIDLKLGTISVDYYEDIFSPTITAKIVITNTGDSIDGQSIYQGLPLRGGERVSLKIAGNAGRPGLDFSQKSDYLYVSAITNVIGNNQSESFVLNLCSREAITNETVRVMNKYPSSSPISTSVEDIIKLLGTSKKVTVDKTMNPYGFIGNMRKPFTVLTWLASKGVPEMKGDGTAGYFFYETKEGYNFRSVDKLIEQKPKATVFSTDIADGENNDQDSQILSHATNRNSNMLEKLRLGAYSSYRVYFDPLTFKLVPENAAERKFGIKDYAGGKSKNLGEQIKLPKINQESNLTLGDIPTRIVSGIMDRGTLEKDASTEGNADPLKYQSQALMRYNVLFTQSLTIMIPSNTNLHAGDIIECNFPKTTTSKNKEYDQQQSGLYMIKELCHHFDASGSYTSAKLIRDTFGQYGTNNKES
jgi:hypothetical protein